MLASERQGLGGVFEWDDANVDHIAVHNVSVNEAEEALVDTRRTGIPVRNVGRERRWGAVGSTDDGRLLFIVFTRRQGRIRIVSARDASRVERCRYRG